MKKLSKKLIVSLLFLSVLFSNIPFIEVRASTKISEIRISSSTTSVSAGVLPDYTVSTTTEHITVSPSYPNGWVKSDEISTWSGFGSETPTAVDDGKTHYALDIAVDVETGYELDQNATIYFNGVDVTKRGYTVIDSIHDWGGYVSIDLGTVSGSFDAPVRVEYFYDLGITYVQRWSKIERPDDPSSTPDTVFAGWYTSIFKNTYFDFENTIITQRTDIYADFWLKDNGTQYAVSFMSGNKTLSAVKVNYGEKVTRPTTDPVKVGYIFDNWYADSSFTTPFDFNSPINEYTVVYAKFLSDSIAPSVYTIESGDGQSFTLGGANDIVIKASGDLAKLTAIKVDGTTLAGSNYKTESGNTVLTLLNSYLNTLSVGNHTVTFVYNDGSVEAALKVLAAQNQSKDETGPTVQTADMYRLYNPNSGEHFYTANIAEKDNLVGLGWIYEGIGWKAPKESNTPVYRLYNPNAGDHHYTMDAGEKDHLVSVGWNYEGIGWYSDDAKTVPLYRQYNPNAIAGSHNYTTNKAENDYLASVGWDAEGIGWYGVK